jgi:hypothetical protein
VEYSKATTVQFSTIPIPLHTPEIREIQDMARRVNLSWGVSLHILTPYSLFTGP